MQLLDFYCYIVLYLSRIFKILCVIYLFFNRDYIGFSGVKNIAVSAIPKIFPDFSFILASRTYRFSFPRFLSPFARSATALFRVPDPFLPAVFAVKCQYTSCFWDHFS